MKMKLTDEQLESMLRAQAWIEPGADFTQNVMQRVALERALQSERAMPSGPALRVARRARWTERMLTATPIAAVVGVMGYHGRTIGAVGMAYLKDIGMWLEGTTGVAAFANYPVLILGVVAPILAGAVASCALSGRCRLTSR